MMTLSWRSGLLAVGLCLSGCAGPMAERWQVSTLVPGTPMHGINGLAWGPDGMLYAGSVMGQTISRVDPASGAVTTAVGPPWGEADDVAVAADGTLAWTAIVSGEIRVQRPGGAPVTVAKNLKFPNPIVFDKTGRLFAAEIGANTKLYEVDATGARPPRLIMSGLDNLNSFEFGADGRLYGPLWLSGVLVAIDLDKKNVARLAEGLGTPAAVNLDSHGRLISGDWNTGEVKRTDPASGRVEVLAKLAPPLDNLAVGADDTIYVSDTGGSGVIAIDPRSGATRRVAGGAFSTPGGLAIATQDGREVLIVADSTGYRFVDPATGVVTRSPFSMRQGSSTDVAADARFIVATNARMGFVQKIHRATGKLIRDVRDLKAPYGAAILADGDVLVADYTAGTISRIDDAKIVTMAEGLRGPVGLAMDGADGVFVGERGAGMIVRLDLKTGTRRKIARDLRGPEGIALLPDGRIAVAEADANRVSIFDPATGRAAVIADNIPFGFPISRAPVGMPSSVAVGRDGAIYVNADGDNSIRKISKAK
jgi:DNA-binding beta-propeller fold protein YncE